MSWMPNQDCTLIINGKTFTHCTVDFTIDRDMTHIGASTFTFAITPVDKAVGFLAPQMINYAATDTYRCNLMAGIIEVFCERARRKFPLYRFWVEREIPESIDPLSAEELCIFMQYHEQGLIELGGILNLMWMDDPSLYTHIEEAIRVDKEKQKKIELERIRRRNTLRAIDPLYEWKERMKRIGYLAGWRLINAQMDDPKGQFLAGDTLLYVQDQGLRVFDSYVLIGPFADLFRLSDIELKLQIIARHDRARIVLGGHDHDDGSSTPMSLRP